MSAALTASLPPTSDRPEVLKLFRRADEPAEQFPLDALEELAPSIAAAGKLIGIRDDDEFEWRLEELAEEMPSALPSGATTLRMLLFLMRFEPRMVPPAAGSALARRHGIHLARTFRRSVVGQFSVSRLWIERASSKQVSEEPLRLSMAALTDLRASHIPVTLLESALAARLGQAATICLLADLESKRPQLLPRRAARLVALAATGTQHLARLLALSTGDASLNIGRLEMIDLRQAYAATAAALRSLRRRSQSATAKSGRRQPKKAVVDDLPRRPARMVAT